MTYQLIRGDALSLPLADDSVDLICTSPPYFALRSYTDGGEAYEGQIGSEATPQEFLEALWAVTAECVRVLKPSGSMWVNLGDKYAGSAGWCASEASAESSGLHPGRETNGRQQRIAPSGKPRAPKSTIPAKSLMGLPWRYAIGCIDQLGLICRAEVIWAKPNGLPESVTDRVRRSHEQWFHMTKEPRYFSAVDEVREAQVGGGHIQHAKGAAVASDGTRHRAFGKTPEDYNPLGKLPGSVWQIPTEPLRVPDHLGVDHFAAFPSEWPRRIILGWSPSGVCVACGEGRRPVVAKDRRPYGSVDLHRGPEAVCNATADPMSGDYATNGRTEATITGYACACPDTTAPTTPAVVLDPFCGTGTTPAVAHALGRHGIGIDLSADYLRLADWRCNDPVLRAKVLRVEKPPAQVEGQASLFGDSA